MCLTTKQKNTKIARKDIVVYKHVIVFDDDEDEKIVSPYQFRRVSVGKVLESLLIIEHFRVGHDDENQVSLGFHSFAHLKDAKDVMQDEASWKCGYKRQIFRCIIPKGAKYVRGEFSCVDSIASNRILYEKPSTKVFSDNMY